MIDVWDDSRIKAGDRWRQNISDALDRAAIAILLISPDFLASEFIVRNELPPLLAAAEQKGTRILPVILRPCGFARDKKLGQFQSINSPTRPLLKLDPVEQDALYEAVAAVIEEHLTRPSN